jgi:hypothetical protein
MRSPEPVTQAGGGAGFFTTGAGAAGGKLRHSIRPIAQAVSSNTEGSIGSLSGGDTLAMSSSAPRAEIHQSLALPRGISRIGHA